MTASPAVIHGKPTNVCVWFCILVLDYIEKKLVNSYMHLSIYNIIISEKVAMMYPNRIAGFVQHKKPSRRF